jgi:hypothetical protein
LKKVLRKFDGEIIVFSTNGTGPRQLLHLRRLFSESSALSLGI